MIAISVVFFAIGICFGLLGAGGSILSVPILTYAFHFPMDIAVSYSFYIVGISAFVGFLGYLRNNFINFKDAILFAIPSIIGVMIARNIIVHAIPTTIYNINSENLLMISFACLMIVSFIATVKRQGEEEVVKDVPMLNLKGKIWIFIIAFLVGICVGLFGAGGGFLIVPVLFNLLKFDIKHAIGTSLFIVTINCLVAILTDFHYFATIVDLDLFAVVVASCIVGMLCGLKISGLVDKKMIQIGFSIFTLFFGLFVLFDNIIAIIHK